jgi:hypothetical protein
MQFIFLAQDEAENSLDGPVSARLQAYIEWVSCGFELKSFLLRNPPQRIQKNLDSRDFRGATGLSEIFLLLLRSLLRRWFLAGLGVSLLLCHRCAFLRRFASHRRRRHRDAHASLLKRLSCSSIFAATTTDFVSSFASSWISGLSCVSKR